MATYAKPTGSVETGQRPDEDRLDQAMADSFPASDPLNLTPAPRTVDEAAGPARREEPPPKQKDTTLQQVIVVVVALIAMAGVAFVA